MTRVSATAAWCLVPRRKEEEHQDNQNGKTGPADVFISGEEHHTRDDTNTGQRAQLDGCPSRSPARLRRFRGHARPQGFGRGHAKLGLIERQRACILRSVFGVIPCTRARIVMQRSGQHVLAQPVPIGAGMGQVQVPCLVDGLGRRHGCFADLTQIHKPPVVIRDRIGKCMVPFVLGPQLGREALVVSWPL